MKQRYIIKMTDDSNLVDYEFAVLAYSEGSAWNSGAQLAMRLGLRVLGVHQ